ncbi:MAG: A/G-specific adenine glycosylase [Candidatus Melainabacteria bacterium]|nr:A/G-specific adenine glycosylase [Candidatus Melainabacteria bacterium]
MSPSVSETIPAAVKPSFASALEAWYQHDHRRLPWRETDAPYHIWLSEIMLQQTQVATVLPYYQRFLEAFPTVEALAAAPIEQVLKRWEGLGYYARCRNLHRAAQQIVSLYGGAFPQTFEAVESLPGIGRSTAGAILTFAFRQRHPILDGNVKRVLARLFDIEEDVAAAASVKQLWVLSEKLLASATDVYAYNQAIMELGATLCTPVNPSCLLCPVRHCCDSAARGTQAERPVKATKAPPVPHKTIGAGVIWNAQNQVLIQRRPPEGLLGGLWEFPGGKQEPDESIEQTVLREIAEELDIQVHLGQKIVVVKHAYTHFKITLHAFHCQHLSGTPTPRAADAWQWVEVSNLRQFAFPKANLKIIEALQATSAGFVAEASTGTTP